MRYNKKMHTDLALLQSPAKAVVLLNLGTPEAPTPECVGAYLREFLMDPLVVDMWFPLRWFLVNQVIVPRRSHVSAEAYSKIWTERGSPLWIHLEDLVPLVQARLGLDWKVVPAMRYGRPSVEECLKNLSAERVREVIFVPLYPQYSKATTESSFRETRRHSQRHLPGARILEMPPFYGDKGFIQSFGRKIRETLETFPADAVLFSFHGLPERQVKQAHSDSRQHCLLTSSCCECLMDRNAGCYRAQCYETARLLAQELGIHKDAVEVSFQSRLGKEPWIQPYTEATIQRLARKGVKRLAVACPSFVSDCLETLEEIQMRGQELFAAAGGEELRLVPSLNSDPAWAEALSQMVLRLAHGARTPPGAGGV